MIIGLTGSMGAGKGEVVKILQDLNFNYITLSDLVREEAKARGFAMEREILMNIGNEMRKAEGAGTLALRALRKMEESGAANWVIDGIRNPAEINELRTAPDSHVLGIHAGNGLLVERILKRARPSDPKSADEINKKIQRELGKGEAPDGQQVAVCMQIVDLLIKNEGTLYDLRAEVMNFYNRLRPPQSLKVHPRPSKDQYYMDLARSVCRRGTCLKVEIGAVIIRDDQVVATGYAGAPRGTKSSQEHGFCLRVKMGIPSGHRYEMCRSVHAEQNAIINSARSGTSLLGGDMYIFGKKPGTVGDPIDAFPCFICKKMLINCGLKRVVCSLKDGGVMVFEVDEWVREWSTNDIIDDKYQYGKNM